MGCPISSFKQFENNVKHSNQKWNIILLANAESDSDAVSYILNNYHELDIVSADVRFYLPGYDLNKRSSSHFFRPPTKNEIHREVLREDEMAKTNYPDFHVQQTRSLWISNRNSENRRVRCIHSPDYGPILFNIAEFSDFIIHLTNKIDDFHYLGGAQMIVISQRSGNLDYYTTGIYELSPLAKTRNLDRFFDKVFQIIHEGSHICESQDPKDFLKILVHRNGSHSVIARIDCLYERLLEDTWNESFNQSNRLAEELFYKMSYVCPWNFEDGNFYFLSYAEADRMYAYTLKETLEKVGINVWMAPYSIPQDCSYPAAITTAIKVAKHFLVLISPNSIRSENVKSEIAIARRNANRTKTKILLKDITVEEVLSDCELEYMIGRLHMKYYYQEVTRNKEILMKYLCE